MGRTVRWRLALGCAGLALLACGGSERLVRVDGVLHVDRTGVSFEETELGTIEAALVSLWHSGRIAREVTVEVSGEGFEAPPVIFVEPGGATALELVFRPAAEGQATGSVRLFSHDQEIAITLFGEGRRPAGHGAQTP